MNDPSHEKPPARLPFPQAARLRSPSDFRLVYQHRRSVSDEVLLIYARPNALAITRFGASVSRKVGGAVARNRWRRLLKESFRLTRRALPTGLDVIAIPRVTEPPGLEAIQGSMTRLMRRIEKRARS